MEIINDRILKIDLNDPTLTIRESVTNKIVIYPNPVLNTVTIKTSSSIEKLIVYDVLGKPVLEISDIDYSLEYDLDMSGLISGIYQLQIKTINGIETKKIVKQ